MMSEITSIAEARQAVVAGIKSSGFPYLVDTMLTSRRYSKVKGTDEDDYTDAQKLEIEAYNEYSMLKSAQMDARAALADVQKKYYAAVSNCISADNAMVSIFGEAHIAYISEDGVA